VFKRFENYFYGSSLSNSDLRPTNAYGWGFEFKKNSPQNLLIRYTGVFHLGTRIRHRILEKILKGQDLKKKELFDAGCGMGLASIYWSKRFKNVFGVDLEAEKIRQAKISARDNNAKNIDFKRGDLLKNNFTKRKFDIAICFEVIEHVYDDQKLIKTLASRLKKNGTLILSFPSNSLLSAIAQKSLDHQKIGYLVPDIKKLSKNAGLKIVKEYSFGNTPIAKSIIAFDFLLRKTFPILSALIFPVCYPFVILDSYMPKMGTPRGYVLVLSK
jgi:SAM-dependent methyltransferase